MVEEARLEESAGGLVPANDGWFVVNVRDGRWVTNEVLGDACIFEGDNVYPRSELAIRHGAGVETETSSPAEAYAPFPKWKDARPAKWDGLPWA